MGGEDKASAHFECAYGLMVFVLDVDVGTDELAEGGVVVQGGWF